ncbi:MAG: hypothetical protein LBN02_08070 [Oscillospiraceae bacterium]|jgi:hypothetical protein|nr:hypothetical protein [Oscillospiraceae bacterium]
MPKGQVNDMDNPHFLSVLKKSFVRYLETGSRSNEKLKGLHSAIANDILERLKQNGGKGYSIASLGVGDGREGKISGRYVDKAVDITVIKNGSPVAGVAVKYVMSNYMQNSNNYFENMLGETANIRCADIQYFQVFIIPDRIPYFNNNGKITKWETINSHNLQKYIALSHDNTDKYMHTPDKTLVFIVNISGDENPSYTDKDGYVRYYLSNEFALGLTKQVFEFGKTIVYNDYEQFAEKIAHAILSV